MAVINLNRADILLARRTKCSLKFEEVDEN